MRHPFVAPRQIWSALLALTALLATPGSPLGPIANAQDKQRAGAIKKVIVGFPGYQRQGVEANYKFGLWTPLFVEIEAGQKGLDAGSTLRVETADSEDVGVHYSIPIQVAPQEARTFVAYAKPGTMHSEFRVVLNGPNGRELDVVTERHSSANLIATHVLTLGSRFPDLFPALFDRNARFDEMGNPLQQRNQWEVDKVASHLQNIDHLPDLSFGYDGVDLVVLSTANNNGFLEKLQMPKYADRLRALAQWVRRGGTLAISADAKNQDILHKVLSSPAWGLKIPVVPPTADLAAEMLPAKRLFEVESWARVQAKQFPNPGVAGVRVAQLDPGRVPQGDWEVQARTSEGRPVIARVRFGFGSIVYFGFSFDDASFQLWDGRVEFFGRMIELLAPATRAQDNEFVNRGFRQLNDRSTSLLRTLDLFDVEPIDFKWVALFILLYIIVAGPIDFIVLRYVVKRMELTWITFPAMVLAISGLAYFTAYALKGKDLHVNKVDVFDIDLRTELSEGRKPKRAYVRGTSVFCILSPRIKNYTIGVEPNPGFWQGSATETMSADVVTWAGRPDSDAWGMSRGGGATGLFRQPYKAVNDGAGLVGVPIPVWTTKAFTASWEVMLPNVPIEADLRFTTDEGRDTVAGKIVSHLAWDLDDAHLIYSDRVYPIKGGIPSSRNNAAGSKLELEAHGDFRNWVGTVDDVDANDRPHRSGGLYNPTTDIKSILFHGRLDTSNTISNHSYRNLDWSWRIKADRGGQNDRSTREGIIVARVKPLLNATAAQSDAVPMPTRLWLQDGLPGPGVARDPFPGRVNQDIYVRIIVPILPVDR